MDWRRYQQSVVGGCYRSAHRLWRLLPQNIRRQAFHKAINLVGPHPDSLDHLRPGPVTVLGLLRSTTGLGSGARLCLQALQELGYETSHFDVSKTFLTADLPNPPGLGREAKAAEGGVVIAHINPHMLALSLFNLGRARLAGKYVIGYWAWELEAIPTKWLDGIRYVHEIWVPSAFTATAFKCVANVPIRVVPHPVRKPSAATLTRSDLGLKAGQFVVLTLFHMGSGFERKNPAAAIAAFKQAFGSDGAYQLIVKVADAEVHPHARQELFRTVDQSPNITILEEKLDESSMQALISCCDVVLSLHRSEGFGLVLAEAMRLGKVAVATGWSGNMDFMKPTNSVPIGYRLIPVDDPQGNYVQSDQNWAAANTAETAQWLQRLAYEPALRNRLGRNAALDTAKFFAVSTYGKTVESSLRARSRINGTGA